MTRTKVHLDISDYASWRAACGTMPAPEGRNLTIAENQVTCRKCWSRMAYPA